MKTNLKIVIMAALLLGSAFAKAESNNVESTFFTMERQSSSVSDAQRDSIEGAISLALQSERAHCQGNLGSDSIRQSINAANILQMSSSSSTLTFFRSDSYRIYVTLTSDGTHVAAATFQDLSQTEVNRGTILKPVIVQGYYVQSQSQCTYDMATR